jgi:hypothetical protein
VRTHQPRRNILSSYIYVYVHICGEDTRKWKRNKTTASTGWRASIDKTPVFRLNRRIQTWHFFFQN